MAGRPLDCDIFDRHGELVLEVLQAGRPRWTEKAAHLARLAGEIAQVDGIDVCPFAGMPEARAEWLAGWRWMEEVRAMAVGETVPRPARRAPAAEDGRRSDVLWLRRLRRKYVVNPGVERGAMQDDDA